MSTGPPVSICARMISPALGCRGHHSYEYGNNVIGARRGGDEWPITSRHTKALSQPTASVELGSGHALPGDLSRGSPAADPDRLA